MKLLFTCALALSTYVLSAVASPTCTELATSGITIEPYLSAAYEYDQTQYCPATGTARVGPGNRWTGTVEALEPYNVTVVGGRIGHVGVGGYLVLGGLSYLSTQYGFAADSIVGAEVVLANGQIVTASSTSHADLLAVIKGGRNNFGIVTTYILKTHPTGLIWGGLLVFEASDAVDNALLLATRNFVQYYPDDKAAVIVTNDLSPSNATFSNIWAVFLFYDGAVLPAGIFDNFTSIGPVLNTATAQTYSSLLSQEDSIVFNGDVYMIATEFTTLPSASVGLEVMGSYHDYWKCLTLANAQVAGLTGTITFQPIPKRLVTHSLAAGGDLLALDTSADRIFIEFDYSYTSTADVPHMTTVIETLVVGIRKRVLAFIASGTIANAYLPLFANDANYQQDYWSRLRPTTVLYAEVVRLIYDPFGFFKARTGGWKLPF